MQVSGGDMIIGKVMKPQEDTFAEDAQGQQRKIMKDDS